MMNVSSNGTNITTAINSSSDNIIQADDSSTELIFALSITTNVIRCLVILLHSLGAYLLTTLYREGANAPEKLYIINLSISEVIFNFFDFFSTPLSVIPHSISPEDAKIIEEVQEYIIIVNGYGVVPVYFLSMIFLTIDRLLDIVLCLHYHYYITTRRTKGLLLGTWCISLFAGVILAFIHRYATKDFVALTGPMVKFVYPTFEFIFILVAFLTYGFLFHKYRKSRVPPVQRRQTVVQRMSRVPSVLQAFQTSRFHIPVMLITSFLLFITVSDLLYSFGQAEDYGVGDAIENEACRLMIGVGCLSDAIIYIFMSPSVKRLLMKKLPPFCRRVKVSPNTSASKASRGTSVELATIT